MDVPNLKRNSVVDWMFRTHSRIRILILTVADASMIALAFIGAFVLACPESNICRELIARSINYIPLAVVCGLSMFSVSGMYRTLWRYAGIHAILNIAAATLFAVVLSGVIIYALKTLPVTWNLLVVQWFVLLSLVGASRLTVRFIREYSHRRGNSKKQTRILIYGAGDAGEMIVRDLKRNTWHQYVPVAFVDDDTSKHGKLIHNVPVMGGLADAARIVKDRNVDEIVVAMPSLNGTEIRAIINNLRSKISSKVQLKTLPGVAELIDENVTYQQVRTIDVKDLLRRPPVELDNRPVDKLLRNKCVLISGAGGSIGSEICRQVASFKPSRLILFELSEPNAYYVSEELIVRFPELTLEIVVGDITNRMLVDNVFKKFKPQVLFHAAAYKHVPMMEANPWSAVSNNIRGTRVLAAAAAEYGIERFVLISTDKAVRPTSVMGATKRVCEMIVQTQDHNTDGVFCAVRFGNVMGSSGSVIPKFEKQIKSGGPVTVTDPNITRYFMLTSEAVQLVMQAATLKDDGAIYVLDMGEPVKILDVARDMITLAGLEPEKDIPIKFVGLRPGEKLYEELLLTGTGYSTSIEKIFYDEIPRVTDRGILKIIDDMLENCHDLSRNDLLKYINTLVPEYQLNSPDIVTEVINKYSGGKQPVPYA